MPRLPTPLACTTTRVGDLRVPDKRSENSNERSHTRSGNMRNPRPTPRTETPKSSTTRWRRGRHAQPYHHCPENTSRRPDPSADSASHIHAWRRTRSTIDAPRAHSTRGSGRPLILTTVTSSTTQGGTGDTHGRTTAVAVSTLRRPNPSANSISHTRANIETGGTVHT